MAVRGLWLVAGVLRWEPVGTTHQAAAATPVVLARTAPARTAPARAALARTAPVVPIRVGLVVRAGLVAAVLRGNRRRLRRRAVLHRRRVLPDA